MVAVLIWPLHQCTEEDQHAVKQFGALWCTRGRNPSKTFSTAW